MALHRRNLPFDIDEAGYLQRALADGESLASGGVLGLARHLHNADPQAPLLPATAGVLRELTGVGPVGLILVQQLFLAATLCGVWFLVLRTRSRGAAVVACLIVAALPGLTDASRGFGFAPVATATLTCAIALQVRCRDFDRLPDCLLWGVALGLAALARTMVLGLLPGLLIAALVRLAAAGVTGRRLAHLAAGTATGAALAWAWYSASWHNVLAYLRDYGYGQQAASYGQGRPLLSLEHWSFRFSRAADTQVYAPLSAALLLCAAVAVVHTGRLLLARSGRHPGTAGPTSGSPEAQPRPARLARLALAPPATPLIVLLWGYLALSSTRNKGSDFELPLIPLAVVLLVCACWHPGSARALAVAGAVAGALVAVTDKAGLFQERSVVSVALPTGPLTALDSRGSLERYAETFLPGPRSHGTGAVEATLRGFDASTQQLAVDIVGNTALRGVPPVLFFATQDPFLNTNTVGLALQRRHASVPIGVLESPELRGGESLLQQLEDPALGQPSLVVGGPVSADRAAAAFSPLPDDTAADAALAADHFCVLQTVALPDGRTLTLWFKRRG